MTIDWNHESELDAEIRFEQPLTTHADDPEVVLLTGVTGFLGAYLLDELLRRTRARVVCLVRAPDPTQGYDVVRAHLDRLRLEQPLRGARVAVVCGDLAKPRLGMSPAGYDELADTVDVVVHAGAHVHFLRPYTGLRATNVGGTEQLLRLAATRQTKPFHYASSLALFVGRVHERVSERDVPAVDTLKTGYAQSKWVAERKIQQASRRGLPTAIYRLARIGGHSKTGVTCSWHDLFNRLIRACVILGSYPRLSAEFAVVPVDYASCAMVELLRRRGSWGGVFHLVNPRPLAWLELVRTLEELGYPMVEREYGEWLALLKRTAGQAQAERETLARLWMALDSNRTRFLHRPTYQRSQSEALLAGSGIACPELGAEIIENYVKFFISAGYLPAPTGTRGRW
ncbi:MAG: thioester reductase domain-containing protein [Myxococcota bacterium]